MNTQATLPTLETQRRQARDALSVLLGMPPNDLGDLLDGPSAIPVSPPQVIVGIPADLLRRRPDIRSAELQAVAQSAQIGVAKADLFPAFSLIGNLVLLSTDLGTFKLSDMFRWGSRQVQIGPSVQWNILNYGQITNNVRVQDAYFQQLLLAYQRAVLSAQQDVEDNLAAFLRSQDRADLLAKSVTSSRAAVDLAVLQYREGVTDFTTVLTAQQTLLSQQDNLASTLGNISTSLVGVYRALGGGWEIREGEDIVPAEIKAEMRERTNWGRLLAPTTYNLPASREPQSRPRLPGLVTTVRTEARISRWLVLVRAPDPAGRLQGAAEAATATAPEGDGRPARAADGDRQPGSHREHPGHLHGPAGRPGGGVSREGPVPGRAAGQEGPAALRHPAEHVRGQPPAGRGRRSCSTGPSCSGPNPS